MIKILLPWFTECMSILDSNSYHTEEGNTNDADNYKLCSPFPYPHVLWTINLTILGIQDYGHHIKNSFGAKVFHKIKLIIALQNEPETL